MPRFRFGTIVGQEISEHIYDIPIEQVAVYVWADEPTDLHGILIRGSDNTYLSELTTTRTNIGSVGQLGLSGAPTEAFSTTIHVQWGDDEFDIALRVLEDVAPSDQVNVRIYRTDKDWMDVSHLLVEGGRPVVDVVENRAGSARMTLLNDYETVGRNLVYDCDRWLSGTTQPLRCGMFVEIRDRKGGVVLMDGFVTTVTAQSETVAIEVGDGNAILGKQGTTLRRNFYGESAGFEWFDVAIDDEGRPYIDLGQGGGIVDTNQVYWTTIARTDRPFEADAPTYLLAAVQRIRIHASTDGRYIREVTLGVGSRNIFPVTRTLTVSMSIDGSQVAETTRSLRFQPSSEYSTPESTITLTLNPPRPQGEVELIVSGDDLLNLYIQLDRSTEGQAQGEIEASSLGIIKGHVMSTVVQDILGAPRTVDPASTSSRLYITDTDESLSEEPLTNRGRVFVSSGGVSTLDVMTNVGQALNRHVIAGGSCASEVGIARIGGGYALDYLQAMADVPDPTGRRRAFICSKFIRTIRIGDRYSMTDEPKMRIVWAKDRTSEDEVPFASFSPSMTMKNRPSLVTIRATGGQVNVPIIATVEDTSVSASRGLVLESIASTTSVSSDVDAVCEAFGVLTSSELDAWEGQVVLPGIVQGLIETSGDHAGSGIPISITDSRNGLRDYRARVRRVSYDYNAMTTAVGVSNLDITAVNRISDTVAMAQKGNAEAFSAASTATAFNTQYLRLTASGVVLQDINVVTVDVVTDAGTMVHALEDVSVGRMPDGTAVLQARGTSTYNNARRYAVEYLTINGRRLSVPSSIRPDFMMGQTLLVSVTITR